MFLKQPRHNRRIKNRLSCCVCLFFIFLFTACRNDPGQDNIRSEKAEKSPSTHPLTITGPEDALKSLKEGNRRFNNGQFTHIHIKRVLEDEEEEEEPQPFVTILTCSDFKIPSEILFDQDNKNLMVVRTQANLADSKMLDLIDSLALRPEMKLILVLGHDKCKNLESLLSKKQQDIPTSPIEDSLLVAMPKPDSLAKNSLYKISKSNIRFTLDRILKSSPAIPEMIAAHKIFIQGAYYDAKEGNIEYFEK